METLKILAIDDNIVNLATIEQELKHKYDVVPMSSGGRAIRYLNKEKAALVLLDIQMALMDGIETLHTMQTMENNLNRDTPVIALTANAVSGSRERYLGEGFTDYLSKPINGEELEQILNRYIPSGCILTI